MSYKTKLSTDFSKAAHTYNDHAIIHKIVAKKLINQAEKHLIHAKKIIDLDWIYEIYWIYWIY